MRKFFLKVQWKVLERSVPLDQFEGGLGTDPSDTFVEICTSHYGQVDELLSSDAVMTEKA